VGAFEVDPLSDEVAFANRILHREAKVREAFDESGKKPSPCLGIERGRLEARRSVGAILRAADVSLARVVARIERLDPPARDGLVVFYGGFLARAGWPVGRRVRGGFSAHAGALPKSFINGVRGILCHRYCACNAIRKSAMLQLVPWAYEKQQTACA
jgi:hypothetical protein